MYSQTSRLSLLSHSWLSVGQKISGKSQDGVTNFSKTVSMKVISLLRLDGALIVKTLVNPPILGGAEVLFWVSQSGKPRKVARIGLP